jgi:excisionase family DNA binding protein
MQSADDRPTKLAYSVKEACAASSLGRTSIYAHIRAGRLHSKRIGGRTVIPAASLHALLNSES